MVEPRPSLGLLVARGLPDQNEQIYITSFSSAGIANEGKQFTDRQHFLFIRKDQFPILLIDDNYRVFIDFFFQDQFGQFIL